MKGTYTSEGITKLCEGIEGSAITSLKCATATFLKVFAFVSAPLNMHSSCTLFAVSLATTSDQKAELRSLPS